MRPILILPAMAGLALAAVLALPAAAASKAFNFSGFSAIAASAGVKVIFKQGPFAISAEEANGDFSTLRIETRGSTLVVTRQDTWGLDRRHYVVTVSAPNISELRVSSGAHFEGAQLHLADLSVDVSSGAHAQLGGVCKAVSIDV